MGFAISVATHVHRENEAAPGEREMELLTRLEVRSTPIALRFRSIFYCLFRSDLVLTPSYIAEEISY